MQILKVLPRNFHILVINKKKKKNVITDDFVKVFFLK